jgi:hypothetical protein
VGNQFRDACFYLFSWRLITTATLCQGYQTAIRPRQLEVLQGDLTNASNTKNPVTFFGSDNPTTVPVGLETYFSG